MNFRRKKQPVRQSPLEQARQNRASYSYYSSARNTEPTKRLKRERQGPKREVVVNARYIPLALMIIAIIGIVAFSTTLSSSPVVVMAGGESPYNEMTEYKKGISSIFSKSVLYKSKLTISSSKIESEVLKNFPELDSVRVILPIVGRRPVVTIHARQPVLQYKTQNRILVIDAAGFAVCEIDQVEETLRQTLILVEDSTNVDAEVGSKVFTSEAVAFADSFKQQLMAKGITIDKIVLPAVANELDFYLKGSKYYVKADYTGDSRLQAGSYLAVKDKFGSSTPQEYVDVRVEEKAFYK